MSRSLQEGGPKQSEVPEADASAQDRRPRRFFAAPSADAPLVDFPLYEGEPVYGRARAPASECEQQERLKHISKENLERAESPEIPGSEIVDSMAWQDVRRRQKQAAFKEFEQTPSSCVVFKQNSQEGLRLHIGSWGVVFTPVRPPYSRTLSNHFGEWCAKAVLILKFLRHNH